MTEEQPTPEIIEKAVADTQENTAPVVRMQHVIITLADGRRGVFMGPELIKEVEMKLGMVPQLTSVDFDPPRAVAIPVPRETPKPEEAANVVETPNNPEDAAPKAGLE